MAAVDEGIDIIFIILITVVIVAVCFTIAGLVGNIAVCLVILSYKSMHNITNFYLLSLSASDIFILIAHGIRQAMNSYFAPISENSWQMVNEYILKTAVNASTLTITAFTCERYLAICRPFIIQKSPKKSRVKRIIATTWFIAALFALINPAEYIIYNPIWPVYRHPDRHEKPEMMKIPLYLEMALLVLFFFIPMIVVTVLYILIWLKLRESSNGLQFVNRTDRASKRTLKMFVVIIAAFFLCWAPYYIENMTRVYFLTDELTETSFSTWRMSYVILMVSITVYPTLNPLIYTVMSENFRKACKDLLSKLKRKCFKLKMKSICAQKTEDALQDML